MILSQVSFGVLRNPVDHKRNTYGKPKNNSHVAAVHGIGNAVRTNLLPILYAVFRKYHKKKRVPSFSVRFSPAFAGSSSTIQYSELFGSYGSQVPGLTDTNQQAENMSQMDAWFTVISLGKGVSPTG